MSDTPQEHGQALSKPLTVAQCREMMGWQHKSDEEIEVFLNSLRAYLARFLDGYPHKEIPLD